MHNTPPPTEFGDGSFIAQVMEELAIVQNGGRFHHRCQPAGARPPFIAHVRVLKGNGDEIYFDETAEGSVIKIQLAQDNGSPAGNLVITDGPNFFQIDSDQRMNGPNRGRRRRKKYDHPGNGQDFHISRITVEKPLGTVKFDVTAPAPPPLPELPEEYTIKIWHIGDHHHNEATTA